ncbi:MAG: zinc-ribbon domain-containing protein [Deltaproteobacteria bacterium]|nr:zinc-ribbon domain-containing protein [Deltaproteobacteria bacterium]
MIFTCNNCNAQYKISDDRIPAKGAKVKCKKCGNIITVKPPENDLSESGGFQNEATVVQRSPFSEESEPSGDSTRVVSREQAAGIFKSLIREHSQDISQGSEYDTKEGQQESFSDDYQADSGSSQYSSESQESADDRLTSVYESGQPSDESESQEEVEQQVNQMLQDTPEEEDISREATRVVSTDQLKQMVGDEEVSREEPKNYYVQQAQPYVAPKSRGEWYVAIGQMQVGPLSMNEVEEKWGRGEINSTTLVWKAGMAGWQPLMYVPELSHLVPPAQESKVEEPAPVREFRPEPRYEQPQESVSPPESSAFPSLDELTKQEEELKTKKEEDVPLDWKPAAGEALASLVQDEMESMQRGFSTDIPIVSKPEESVSVSVPPESPVLPFERPQEAVTQSPVIAQKVSTPPVVVEQPVVISAPPYQSPYPTAYPTVYSQPPQKAEKSRLIPILIAVFGGILVLGGVLGYFLYTKLSGEKITPNNQVVQQPQQVQPPQPPQQQVQPPQQAQQAEPPKKEEPSKQEEPKKEEEAKPEEPKKETQEPKKEIQKQKVAMKEEKTEKQPVKKTTKKEEEMPPPPPPKEEKKPKKEEIAKEEEPPPKKKPSKGGDPLLDFEGEQGTKSAGSGGLPKTLTQEQILEVVKANIGRIKTCMAEQAQRDSSVKGKLIIGWEIQPNGKTKNVQIKTPQFKGTYIGTCISSVVTDFSFPKFAGPPIPIEFPFNIK